MQVGDTYILKNPKKQIIYYEIKSVNSYSVRLFCVSAENTWECWLSPNIIEKDFISVPKSEFYIWLTNREKICQEI